MNKRLVKVLTGISSSHYSKNDHANRMNDIQDKLDKAFETKQEKFSFNRDEYMLGPAYLKLYK